MEEKSNKKKKKKEEANWKAFVLHNNFTHTSASLLIPLHTNTFTSFVWLPVTIFSEYISFLAVSQK